MLAQLHSHRSIRKYRRRGVSKALLRRIAAAATMASTSGNMQAYSIIATTDPELRKRLLGPHMGQRMVVEAPVLMTFCADFRRMRRWLRLSDAPDGFDNFMSFMIAAIDATLAAQNAAIAAETLGLGICFLGSTLANSDQMAALLRCPPGVVPVVGFTLGYPDEAPARRRRLPLEAVLHHELYQDVAARTLLSWYRRKERDGMRRYLSDARLRELIRSKGATNLAQVYTRVKYTRRSHQEFSRSLVSCLVRQGYLKSRSIHSGL